MLYDTNGLAQSKCLSVIYRDRGETWGDKIKLINNQILIMMKKTIVALLVLASTSFATTEYSLGEYNEWFGSAITDTSYSVGNDYTLTFTLGSFAASDPGSFGGTFLTLGANWGLYTQGWQYLAFDDSTTPDRAGLTTSAGSYTSSNTQTATGSVAQGAEGWFYNLGGPGKQENITVTVSRLNGTDTVSIQKGETQIASFTITSDPDSALDAAGFCLNPVRQSTGNGNPTGVNIQAATFSSNGVERNIALPIPEPTTATLSLLALAGLAARRRRR